MTKLKPGMIGLTEIGGAVGLFVKAGQWLLRDSWRPEANGKRRRAPSHAFIVIQKSPLGGWMILEAMPSGSRFRLITGREPGVTYLDFPLNEDQRYEIRTSFRVLSLEGTKYGFSAYLYLALTRFGLRPEWLKNYLQRNGRFYCSQLVDEALRRVGYQIFDDGRMPYDVTPGDLWYAALEQGCVIEKL